MRFVAFLPVVALSFVMGCAAADSDFELFDQDLVDISEQAYTSVTSSPSLLLEGPNPKVVGASKDRKRVAVGMGDDCGALHVLDVGTGQSTTLVSDGFCMMYGDHKVAMDDEGQRVAFWTWDEGSQIHRLQLWLGQGAPVVVQEYAGVGFELRASMEFGESHLFFDVQLSYEERELKAYEISTETVSLLSTSSAHYHLDPVGERVLLWEDWMGARNLMLRDVQTGQSSLVVTEADWQVHVSPDGRYVAVLGQCLFGEGPCEMSLLDWQTGQVFEAPGKGVSTVAGYAADGSVLAYVASGTLHFWNLVSGMVEVVAGSDVCWAGTNPEASRVVFAADCDGEGRGDLYVVEIGEPLQPKRLGQRVNVSADRFLMSPDGNRLAVTSGSTALVSLWTLSTRKREISTLVGAHSMGFSADSNKLLYGHNTSWFGPCPPYGVCGYTSLRGYDFTRSMLKDQWIEGSAVAPIEYGALHGLYEDEGYYSPVAFPLRSPNHEHLAILSSTGTMTSTYVVDSNSLRSRKVLGSWKPLLTTNDSLLVARESLNHTSSGVYRVSF